MIRRRPAARREGHCDAFLLLCEAHGLPTPQTELRFHETRRWRFDYAWPSAMLAIEREGGVWTSGRHTRGKGFIGDLEKYNAAQLIGWTVLRYTPQQLEAGAMMDTLKQALQ